LKVLASRTGVEPCRRREREGAYSIQRSLAVPRGSRATTGFFGVYVKDYDSPFLAIPGDRGTSRQGWIVFGIVRLRDPSNAFPEEGSCLEWL